MTDIDALDAIYAEATPGKWQQCILDKPLAEIPAYVAEAIEASGGDEFGFVLGVDDHGECDICHVGNGPRSAHNRAAIVAIHNEYPQLSAELRDLRAENEKLRAENERLLKRVAELGS